ncbi:hypothetical protein [Roseibium polysiphoniae]|uniref:hypothetical protein n=1 Tax=Roseibium polysiphoniae TaxID=2571221 RepID=UPI0032969C0D
MNSEVSAKDYSTLSSIDKMVARLSNAAEVVAFMDANIVSPGSETHRQTLDVLEPEQKAVGRDTKVVGSPTSSVEQNSIQEEIEHDIRNDLKRVLSTFEKTDPARSVLVHVLTGASSWKDSKNIAATLGLTVQQVTIAKRKITRRLKNNFPALRKHIDRDPGSRGASDERQRSHW